ncbi:hypothetical protein XFF6166_340019 [Xanthomonas citri pv. fuscans]|nr:hypothetical protein XFF6166_340019 [Xanthomonas citri pv. fuscans]SOO02463.1 hypothetical protein XFF6960_620017 [Xanthomonas citri pv. fuscans]SOO09804.1 hypothetical protein XFF6970_460002 [Xanthomonas citri pv. fuscans]SOO13124.1 hypothetical protein XFF7766_120019 [Xanthomonas citri pv. fuscans]SOO44287.1 hypothetical protein XFF1815_50002 [Xanthomonas citri pv. fuscans]
MPHVRRGGWLAWRHGVGDVQALQGHRQKHFAAARRLGGSGRLRHKKSRRNLRRLFTVHRAVMQCDLVR